MRIQQTLLGDCLVCGGGEQDKNRWAVHDQTKVESARGQAGGLWSASPH